MSLSVAGLTGTTVTTFAAGATAFAVTTGSAIAFTAGTTVTTGRAGTLGGFNVAFGLGLKRTQRQTVLTCFLVDFNEFHCELITLLDAR